MNMLKPQQVVKPTGSKTAAPRQPARHRQIRAQAAVVDKASAAATTQPYGRIFNFSAGPANLPLEVSSSGVPSPLPNAGSAVAGGNVY